MNIGEPMHESLKGIVQKIIFANEETGFSVAVVKSGVAGSSREITISGNLWNLAVGEEILAEGNWVEHPKYGKQFKASCYMKVLPTKVESIEAYLSSGMIKGLGPSTARKIVAAFGVEALDILSKAPHRLMEISGIGEKKCAKITGAWKEQMAVTDIMVLLSGCGITPAYASRIYRRYGLESIRIIQENPYQISYDVEGIGFMIADRIAHKIGYPENSLERIQAGTLYALEEGKKEGHVYLPESLLCSRAVELLNIEKDQVRRAIKSLASDQRVFIEEIEGQSHVYPKYLYVHETEAAGMLRKLANAPSNFRRKAGDLDAQIRKSEHKFGVQLSPEQRNAVTNACTSPVSVLTGGPGTGKTLTTRIIVEIFREKRAQVLLAAPTGRAAKRLENCGHEARTIHRLLEYSPREGGFMRGADNPFDCNLLIIDEVSMADITLFFQLLTAVPVGAHLVIIGDADQLPSVGPGLVMRHLVESRTLPVTVLNRIFRQEEGSGIVQVAHFVNQGIIPSRSQFVGDCLFFQCEEPARAVAKVIELVTEMRKEGIEPQVISPMHKGEAGTDRLNDLLQAELNPIPLGEENDYQVVSGFRRFRINDRVIQTKNNYDKDVFNGDSGVIGAIDVEEQQLVVLFEGRGPVSYDFADLDQLSLSYAITVHKSQGSEYDAVILLCLNQHFIMLARNLLYTAISRAKKKVILVGTPKALAIAIRNDKQKTRFTRFKERLLEP